MKRRYVRLPGSVDEPMLMVDFTISGSCTSTSFGPCERWAHQDRLGSVIATTDQAGAVVERYKYGAYGELGSGSASGFPFRFTGQKIDAETGLYYYKARYYDPETGRFLQTDPIGYEDQMNLYGYAGNDPVNAADPEGKFLNILGGAAIGAAISAGVNVGKQILDGALKKGGPGIDLKQVAIAAVGGAATGAVLAATGNLAIASAAGGAISGAVSVASDAASGKLEKDPGGTAVRAGISAVVGAIVTPLGAAAGQALSKGIADDVAIGVAAESLGVAATAAATEAYSASDSQESDTQSDACNPDRECSN